MSDPAQAALNVQRLGHTPSTMTGTQLVPAGEVSTPLPAARTSWDKDARQPQLPQDEKDTPQASQLRQSFQDQATAYEQAGGTIPYVWGGNAIGSPSVCQECRQCIERHGYGVKTRLRRCNACRQCGVDCSHFVQKIFTDVGLKMPYADTSKLIRANRRELESRFGLVDIGRDLSLAKPGDLMLHRRHVVVLLHINPDGTGDIIHSTRGKRSNQPGGVQVLRGVNLKRFRGPIMKILRHVELMPEGWNGQRLNPPSNPPTDEPTHTVPLLQAHYPQGEPAYAR